MDKSSLPQLLKRLDCLLGNLCMKLNFVKNLASVPQHCYVIRLARQPKDFSEKKRILAIQVDDGVFNPSTDDRQSIPPHLSVWVDFMTTPEQAYSFLQENNPNSDKKLVLRLPVSEIRKIIGIADKDKTYPGLLNVIWVFLQKSVRNKCPGAKGHSGITGGLFEQLLPDGLTNRQKSDLRKYLRSELAKLASKDCFLLEEDKLLINKTNKLE